MITGPVAGESLTVGELFAGGGGLGLAVSEVFGARLSWYSEWEPAPSKVMAHHWPAAPNLGDITKIDWATVPKVDIISGGSPCQDLSLSGARRGMSAGTRSGLWESMREAIAIIQPRYVVWENVRGALSATAISEMDQREGRVGSGGGTNLRALGRVLGDLADLGFDAEWRGIRAADVGLAHSRFRVFLLATHRNGGGSGRRATVPGNGETQRADAPALWSDNRPCGPGPATTTQAIADAASERGAKSLDRRQGIERAGVSIACSGGTFSWGRYAAAIRRAESAVGRRAPAPTELSPRGKARLSPAFAEWFMGWPAGHVTDVPDLSWEEQIKIFGNGVVPQQAAAALRDMLAT